MISVKSGYQETFGFNSDTKGKWHTMTRRAKA